MTEAAPAPTPTPTPTPTDAEADYDSGPAQRSPPHPASRRLCQLIVTVTGADVLPAMPSWAETIA